MTQSTALITGITGQDGSYLADFLLTQGPNSHRLPCHGSHTGRRFRRINCSGTYMLPPSEVGLLSGQKR